MCDWDSVYSSERDYRIARLPTLPDLRNDSTVIVRYCQPFMINPRLEIMLIRPCESDNLRCAMLHQSAECLNDIADGDHDNLSCGLLAFPPMEQKMTKSPLSAFIDILPSAPRPKQSAV
jgi:hypothetical protein